MDRYSDQLVDHRRLRILNIVDDHSRFCPGQIVDMSISGARLARYLDELAERHGLPQEIVLDNSPAGTSRAMFQWSERTGVRLRDECLNMHWFRSLRHAREEIATRRHHDNSQRPHSALGYRTPIECVTTAPPPELGEGSTAALIAQPQPENSTSIRP